MSETSEYIADLVEFGKHDYDDLNSVELGEIALLIYKEASNEERKDMILDSWGADDFFSLLFPFLNNVDQQKTDNFKVHAKVCLIEMSVQRTKELIMYEVDNLEENNRLRQQDSDYDQHRENQL